MWRKTIIFSNQSRRFYESTRQLSHCFSNVNSYGKVPNRKWDDVSGRHKENPKRHWGKAEMLMGRQSTLPGATAVAHGPRCLRAASIKCLIVRAQAFIARNLLPCLYYFVSKKCLMIIMPPYFHIPAWNLLGVQLSRVKSESETLRFLTTLFPCLKTIVFGMMLATSGQYISIICHPVEPGNSS